MLHPYPTTPKPHFAHPAYWGPEIEVEEDREAAEELPREEEAT